MVPVSRLPTLDRRLAGLALDVGDGHYVKGTQIITTPDPVSKLLEIIWRDGGVVTVTEEAIERVWLDLTMPTTRSAVVRVFGPEWRWMLPQDELGQIPSEHVTWSTLLLVCSALRVSIGKTPVRFLRRWRRNRSDGWCCRFIDAERWGMSVWPEGTAMDLRRDFGLPGWELVDEGGGVAQGPEWGPAGIRCAEAAALEKGCALEREEGDPFCPWPTPEELSL